MKKFTSLMLMLLCAVTTWGQVFTNDNLKELTPGYYYIYYTDANSVKHYIQTNGSNSFSTVTENPNYYSISVGGGSQFSKAYYIEMNGYCFSNPDPSNNHKLGTGTTGWNAAPYISTVVFENGDGLCAMRSTNAAVTSWDENYFITYDESNNIVAIDGDTGGESLFVWTIETAPYVDITYNYMYDGKVIGSETITSKIGEAFPALKIPFGFTSNTTIDGNVSVAGTHTIECALIENMFADSYESINTWYYLVFDSNNKFYLHHDADQGFIDLDAKEYDRNNLAIYSWAFIGNPIDGFQIVNKGAGSEMILSCSETMEGTEGGNSFPVMTATPVPEGNNELWIGTNSTHGTNGFFLNQKGIEANKMNNRGKLAFWTGGAGTGSTFMIEEVVEEVEITYVYKLNGETKHTENQFAVIGREFPTPTAVLPYGVTATKPAGNITAAGNYDVTLEVSKDVPFTAAATADKITNWYYVKMHPSYPTWLGDTNEDGSAIPSVDGNSIDENNPEKFVWGFAGDLWNGYVMVNKGTGRQATLSSGSITMTESGTAFIASHSDLSGDGYFSLKSGSDYLNANHSAEKVATWSEADGGSTIMLTECPIHTLNVSEAEYATLYLDYNAYIPADVEAYVVAGLGTNWANLTQVTGTLPAGNGIIVKAAAGEYEFITSLTTAATIEANELRGSITTETITPADNTTYYILAMVEGEVGLYPDELADGTFSNNANKAYLPVTSENAATGYSFVFDWAGTTGIEGVAAESAQNGKIYDITGREVKAVTAPGLYIINGKKVVK